MAGATPVGADFEKLGENRFFLKVVPNLPIGEFRECSGLSVERDILEYAEGGNNDFVYKLPGRLKYPNLVLKRGTTDQDGLMRWLMDSRTKLQMRSVTVTLVDPTGATAREWAFENAHPVKWIGPNLNAGSDSASTETLEIAHGGLVSV